LKPLKASKKKPSRPNPEFDLSRHLHDRFCKFEASYIPAQAILTLSAIKLIVDPKILIDADLGFKLNNLRWFLTPDGKKFLLKQEKRHILNQKLDVLTFETSAIVKEIEKIEKDLSPKKKVGDDKEYVKKVTTMSDFLNG
jgi:hypothetical protein